MPNDLREPRREMAAGLMPTKGQIMQLIIGKIEGVAAVGSTLWLDHNTIDSAISALVKIAWAIGARFS